MLAFILGANQVDVWVAKQQRRQLGLCERCGGVNEAASCGVADCPMRGRVQQQQQAPGGGGGSS